MIKIKLCKIQSQSFCDGYYSMYCAYQKELRNIDRLPSESIETETECIIHQTKCLNYKNCTIWNDGAIIGIISFQNVNFLHDGQPPILFIDHFYIKPEYRHRGFGKQTFQEMVKSFPKHTIHLNVLANNAPAVSFWKKVIESSDVDEINDERCKTDQELAGEYTEPYIKHILRRKNGK